MPYGPMKFSDSNLGIMYYAHTVGVIHLLVSSMSPLNMGRTITPIVDQ